MSKKTEAVETDMKEVRRTRLVRKEPVSREVRNLQAKIELYGPPRPGNFTHPTFRRVV